jgi:amino-acid N-acetyltransferase
MEIVKAKISDVPEMQELINLYADRGELLPRSLNQIYEDIRDFLVLKDNGKIVGTCALHVNWQDLAEIKALVVDESLQGRGLGRKIVEACIEDAKEMGISRVFALTYKPTFFAHLGFHEVDKSELPHKVWTECIHCVKFPNCGEVAVLKQLG